MPSVKHLHLHLCPDHWQEDDCTEEFLSSAKPFISSLNPTSLSLSVPDAEAEAIYLRRSTWESIAGGWMDLRALVSRPCAVLVTSEDLEPLGGDVADSSPTAGLIDRDLIVDLTVNESGDRLAMDWLGSRLLYLARSDCASRPFEVSTVVVLVHNDRIHYVLERGLARLESEELRDIKFEVGRVRIEDFE